MTDETFDPEDAPTRARRREQWRALDAASRGAFDRRDFLLRAGAAMALAGLGACTRAPKRKILPYASQPPGLTPGVAQRYATAVERDGYGVGLLVECHEGRPTKVEGNPSHPDSLGATSALDQAEILSLYDPTRLSAVRRAGQPATWDALSASMAHAAWRSAQGEGLHVVMQPTASPSIGAQLDALRARYPKMRVHFHAVAPRRSAFEAAKVAFGAPLERRLELAAADRVLVLDRDVLGEGPAMQRHARGWAARRRDPLAGTMNRLYAVESRVTPTGMAADHRLPSRYGDIAAFVARLAAEIAPLELAARLESWKRTGISEQHEAWIRAVAADLAAHRGAGAIVAGDAQPAEVHLLVDVMNAVLGNIGRTVLPAPSPLLEPGAATHDLHDLASALRAGEVEQLVVLGIDLLHAAPADLDLARLLSRARASLYIGTHADATAAACHWTAPLAHAFESWGDTRALDGTAAVIQPLIAPIRHGRSVLEALAMLSGNRAENQAEDRAPEGYSLVRAVWKRAWSLSDDDFERRWEDTLARGTVEGTAFAGAAPLFAWDRVREALAHFEPRAHQGDALEITFPRDVRADDGRAFTNPWLLELPDPVTKLTWENAISISPATGERLKVESGDRMALELRGRRVELAALVVPGHPDDSLALPAGWGRAAEDAGPPRGVNAHLLATSTGWHADIGLRVQVLEGRGALPRTQSQHRIPSRDQAEAVYRHIELAEYRRDASKLGKKRHLPQLYGPPPPALEAPGRSQQWAMAIDLGLCTGCSACVVACQAENNVPAVGAEGVAHGRAMHWLRIDTYEQDRPDAPYGPQPMLCQHCEMAPCEYVCPVNATVHSGDGLNEMVYNRCVGTRFCSNNCPYKVRRFNWFDYHRDDPPLVGMARNPDVTVRTRGVMEKCSFCVQRIREVEIRTRSEGRPAENGELQTACQQACPSRAIVFGDVHDASSEVARLHANPRAYGALEELGTRPRVQYLTRIRNRNEDLP